MGIVFYLHPPREKQTRNSMKCNPLRRRYVVFRLIGEASDTTINSSLVSLTPKSTMTRLIRREGSYIIARVDHMAALEIRMNPSILLDNGNAELKPISTTGSVLKAKEKIKKLLREQETGDEEAVPVKQNNKMLIK